MSNTVKGTKKTLGVFEGQYFIYSKTEFHTGRTLLDFMQCSYISWRYWSVRFSSQLLTNFKSTLQALFSEDIEYMGKILTPSLSHFISCLPTKDRDKSEQQTADVLTLVDR